MLSKIIIFVTRNNVCKYWKNLIKVVNCFQKLLSSWRGTTKENKREAKRKLWIAFKNYYLRDEEQPEALQGWFIIRCELLSKIIIFVTRNNSERFYKNWILVVNCFQKLLSSWRGTTSQVASQTAWLLWIAFKNYYLRDEEQRGILIQQKPYSCELLSKIIIFVTRNNATILSSFGLLVVNCFQKLLSSWRGTTFLLY